MSCALWVNKGLIRKDQIMAKYPPGTFFVALREFEGTAQKGDTFYVSKISTEFIYLRGIGEKISRIRFKGFSSLEKFEEFLFIYFKIKPIAIPNQIQKGVIS